MATKYLALVDDEAPVRQALGRLLRLAGYEVLGFATGQEFLDSLHARLPDCVLLDIHMPGLSGLQVRDELKSAKFDLPIVFITASDDAELADQALCGGAKALLRKPFPRQVLLDAVDAALLGKPNLH
jgi:FixJ family two-component response regulator